MSAEWNSDDFLPLIGTTIRFNQYSLFYGHGEGGSNGKTFHQQLLVSKFEMTIE